ncbi:MAG: 23S rRNA (adenine(2503)-C(2))-methyltransferase RlmN [Candidatus Buchananbacteria bacterium]
MNLTKLEDILKRQPKFRLKQINEAIFSQFIETWDEASSLPKDLRDLLKKECSLEIKTKIFKSADNSTIKAAITLADGEITETVLMRHGTRNTVCVSCQVGCALACDFCATGQLGFKRNLTADEICEQVLVFERLLKPENQKVSNIVFMGMGEPLLNFDEVAKAIKIINDQTKFSIGARHISVSTVGITEGIKKLADFPLQINLAISIHSPSDTLRSRLMPINQKYPLSEVLTAAGEYLKKTKRKLMIEYVMLKGINDSPAQAKELALILKKYLPHLYFVNLIAYNQTERFQGSLPKTIKEFKMTLEKAGVTVFQRYKFGSDIKGACGQLAGELRENK